MPNPFLTNAAQNKKGRRANQERNQERNQENRRNPFLAINHRSHHHSINSFSNLNPVAQQQLQPQPHLSFEESFPLLSQSQTSKSQTVQPLNFKSAIQSNQEGQPQGHQQGQQQGQQHQQSHQHQQSQQQGHQHQQSQNQFLQNKFFQPPSTNDHIWYEHNDLSDNNDAYDSAYTKYYDDDWFII